MTADDQVYLPLERRGCQPTPRPAPTAFVLCEGDHSAPLGAVAGLEDNLLVNGEPRIDLVALGVETRRDGQSVIASVPGEQRLVAQQVQAQRQPGRVEQPMQPAPVGGRQADGADAVGKEAALEL